MCRLWETLLCHTDTTPHRPLLRLNQVSDVLRLVNHAILVCDDTGCGLEATCGLVTAVLSTDSRYTDATGMQPRNGRAQDCVHRTRQLDEEVTGRIRTYLTLATTQHSCSHHEPTFFTDELQAISQMVQVIGGALHEVPEASSRQDTAPSAGPETSDVTPYDVGVRKAHDQQTWAITFFFR